MMKKLMITLFTAAALFAAITASASNIVGWSTYGNVVNNTDTNVNLTFSGFTFDASYYTTLADKKFSGVAPNSSHGYGLSTGLTETTVPDNHLVDFSNAPSMSSVSCQFRFSYTSEQGFKISVIYSSAPGACAVQGHDLIIGKAK